MLLCTQKWQNEQWPGNRVLARHLLNMSCRSSSSARFCAARADLYSTGSRLGRLTRFCGMIRSGIYRGSGGALIGMRSAFKDLTFALAGPGAPKLLEKVRDTLHLNFSPRNDSWRLLP